MYNKNNINKKKIIKAATGIEIASVLDNNTLNEITKSFNNQWDKKTTESIKNDLPKISSQIDHNYPSKSGNSSKSTINNLNDNYGTMFSTIGSGITPITNGFVGSETTGNVASTLNGISKSVKNVTSTINPLGGAATSVGKLAGNLIGGTKNRVEGSGSAATHTISSGLSLLGPWGMAAGAALELINGIGGTRVKKLVDNTDKISNEFSGTKNDISKSIEKYSGKKAGLFDFGFGASGNKAITEAERKQNLTLDITEEGKKRLNNDMSDVYNTQNMLKYWGGMSNYSLAGKHGIKFPELDEARKLISSWSTKSTKEELQKFQLGGKMNLIPEGALHARKHQLEEIDSSLEGQITKKGIPVVTKSNGGVVQMAEIEKEEWTLRKDFTDQLESLYHLYQKDNSSEAAIKAGKLICYELLKNTDDRSGLIKSVK